MTADELMKAVRNGSDKLRVDNIVLNTKSEELRGKGSLSITENKLTLNMLLDAGQNRPAGQIGIFTKKDRWKLSGFIEDHLPFHCDVGPAGGWGMFNNRITLVFNLHPIQLTPTGWDALSRAEKEKSEAKIRAKNKLPANDKNSVDDISVSFHARLKNYPVPIVAFSGTKTKRINPYFGESEGGKLDTFVGEIPNFKFAFYKETSEGDLHVYLDSKQGFSSLSEESDWKTFYSLMDALAFSEGTHAWPYRIEYWRNRQKRADLITAAKDLEHTAHAPFHLMHSHFGEIIRIGTAFFLTQTPLAREVERILFLFREAGNNGDITTLTLCTLFESLVELIFKEFDLEKRAEQDDASLQSFKTAKKDVANYIQGKVTDVEGYARLLELVKCAKPFYIREKFRLVVNHFNLQWEDDMQLVFKTWQKARNPLVHGHERADQSENEIKEAMLEESRIAGAINILILKLFGYSGTMLVSAFEDKYRKI